MSVQDSRWAEVLRNPANNTNGTADSSATAAGDWETPVPLVSGPQVPMFPLEAFPPGLQQMREFIVGTAEELQVPVDLPAMLMLSVAGACIAKKFEIGLRPGWREIPALYTLTLLDSGERKSATFGRMVRPILAWEESEAIRLGPDIVRVTERRKILEAKLTDLRRKGGTDEGAARSAIQAAQELASTPPVIAPTIYTSDATSEALAGQMIENKERALVASCEADAFDVMMGRYSDRGSPNMGIWLKGHAGDSERVIRRNRPPEHLQRPVLNVGMCVQPEGARGMFGSRAAKGRGLLARFLVAAPASLVGYRKTGGDAAPVDPALTSYYESTLTALLSQPIHPAGPTVVELDSDARRLFVEFERKVESELRRGGCLGDRKDWGGKLCGAVARIALVLHCIEWVAGRSAGCGGSARSVSHATMLAALSWVPYLIEHERAVAGVVGCDPDTTIADKVLRWIERQGIEQFTLREVFTACRCGMLSQVEDLKKPLELLVEHHYVRGGVAPDKADPRKGGRSKSPLFAVNPRLCGKGEA